MPVSRWMVDALGAAAGPRRCSSSRPGPGDVGFLAAELIAPGRHADHLRRRARDAHRRPGARGGARDRATCASARSTPSAIDLPAAALDGVLCRWGYMLMADPEAALRETRRVLRPGARRRARGLGGADGEPVGVAADGASWSSAGSSSRPSPALPGQFALGAPRARSRSTLDAVGLRRVRGRHRRLRDRLPVGRRLDRDQQRLLDDAPQRARAARRRPSATDVIAAIREKALPYVREDGSAVVPARSWVAAAGA